MKPQSAIVPAIPIDSILLAAGKSARMGTQNKLLLPYHQKTLVQHCYEQLANSNIRKTIVVLGHEHQKLREILEKHNAETVYNKFFERGMTSSIQAGMRALPGDADGVMVALADMPSISTNFLNSMVRNFQKALITDPKAILLPHRGSQQGNPVIFSSHYHPQILSHPHPNGCKGIIEANKEHVICFQTEEDAPFRDIDTAQDYEGWNP